MLTWLRIPIVGITTFDGAMHGFVCSICEARIVLQNGNPGSDQCAAARLAEEERMMGVSAWER